MELICIEHKLSIKRMASVGWSVAHPEVLKGDYFALTKLLNQFLKCLRKARLVSTEERAELGVERRCVLPGPRKSCRQVEDAVPRPHSPVPRAGQVISRPASKCLELL